MDTSIPGQYDKLYILTLKYEHTEFPTEISCNGQVILRLPQLLQDITPDNVLEKIRLYILFS